MTLAERFTMRTFARALEDQQSQSPFKRYFFEHPRTFQDLVTHADKVTGLRQEFFEERTARILQFLSEHGYNVPRDLLYEVVLKNAVNVHSLMNEDVVFPETIGSVLYLSGSKMDHTCEQLDNYVQIFTGNRIMLRAVKDFTVSDSLDLKVHYIPITSPYYIRQHVLKEYFHFDCECKRCLEEAQPVVMRSLESFLSRPSSAEWKRDAERFRWTLRRLPNTDVHKFRLQSRLFYCCSADTSIEERLSLGAALLEGTTDHAIRLSVMFLLCEGLAESGANEPSHERFSTFEYYHKMATAKYTDTYGGDHPIVQQLALMEFKAQDSTSLVSVASQQVQAAPGTG